MKKKIIIIIGVFAAAALLALPNILNAVREQKDAKKYDNAFNELFVTEKNAVAGYIPQSAIQLTRPIKSITAMPLMRQYIRSRFAGRPTENYAILR